MRWATGAASAIMMLMAIAAIMVPYLYSELKEKPSMSTAEGTRRRLLHGGAISSTGC